MRTLESMWARAVLPADAGPEITQQVEKMLFDPVGWPDGGFMKDILIIALKIRFDSIRRLMTVLSSLAFRRLFVYRRRDKRGKETFLDNSNCVYSRQSSPSKGPRPSPEAYKAPPIKLAILFEIRSKSQKKIKILRLTGSCE